MLPPLRALLARVRLSPMCWLGRAYRAAIIPAWAGGYRLAVYRSQGVEWIDLPPRTADPDEPWEREYRHPDQREFTAAAQALADRGLAFVLPWELDEYGNLTAPLIPARVAAADFEERNR